MATTNWKENFEQRKFEDSPTFADKVLIPRLKAGDNVYLVSSFAPSYLHRAVELIARNPSDYSGFLNVVLYVPGDLDRRSAGIVRFQKYLLSHFQEEALVDSFVNNAITVLSKPYVDTFGTRLRISILHTSQKSALVKGCLGLVTSRNSDEEDFVTFVDAKAGDHNSPIALLQSWDDYDFIEAQELLGQVLLSSNGEHPRGNLVSAEEVNSWLVYLAEWYEANPPIASGDDDDDDDEFEPDEDLENRDELLDYLKAIGDFEDEEQYGWFDEGESEYDEYIGAFAGFTVVVDPREAVAGHIPPLPTAAAEFVGPARATCVCGRRFFRGAGCPDGTW